jgi:quercetin dioxygenase-like cupin family protein
MTRVARLDDMKGGWFVGDFEPSLCRTTGAEVAVKRYRAEDVDDWHHHKVATELTVIVSGYAEMAGISVSEGDIIVLEPGESSNFVARTDVTVVSVKVPGAKDDKYLDVRPR